MKYIVLFITVCVLVSACVSPPVRSDAPTLTLVSPDNATTLTQTVVSTSMSNGRLLPTYTPYPTQTALPTLTALPTYTPYPTLTTLPTLTALPTYTVYPTQTTLPTRQVIATFTPIPMATASAIPSAATVPTSDQIAEVVTLNHAGLSRNDLVRIFGTLGVSFDSETSYERFPGFTTQDGHTSESDMSVELSMFNNEMAGFTIFIWGDIGGGTDFTRLRERVTQIKPYINRLAVAWPQGKEAGIQWLNDSIDNGLLKLQTGEESYVDIKASNIYIEIWCSKPTEKVAQYWIHFGVTDLDIDARMATAWATATAVTK